MFPTEPVPERLGAYKVIRRLAGIGSADVYLGRLEGPMGFQRVCALKLVPNSIEGDARFAEELAREAAICAQLNHPAIVRMYDFFEHERRLVLVLEHVEGADLERLLQHLGRRKQRLSDNAIWYLAHHLASALSHAHHAVDESGNPLPVVHRNLTPENVLISWDGEVRLGGFGYGKIIGRSPDTVIGTTVKGTPGFMAPEQQRGERATTRADVYGLGALLWSLLAGKPPPSDGSRPDPIGKIRSDIPREIAAAIDATLEASPDKRRITCLELDQWLGKVTDVDTGRAELREKVLLLRSTRSEPGAGDSPRASRPQAQPRRRVSLRSVKASKRPAGSGPLSVPPPSMRPMGSVRPRPMPDVATSGEARAEPDASESARPSPVLGGDSEPRAPAPPPPAPAPAALPAIRTAAALPVERTAAARPIEQSASALPVERTAAALPVERTAAALPVERTVAALPAEPVEAARPVDVHGAPPILVIAPPVPPALAPIPFPGASEAGAMVPPVATSAMPGEGSAVAASPSGWRDIGGDATPLGRLDEPPTEASVPGVKIPSRFVKALTPLQSLVIIAATAGVILLLGIWIVERRGDPPAPSGADSATTAVSGAPPSRASGDSRPAPTASPATPDPGAPHPEPKVPPTGYGYLTVSSPNPATVFLNGSAAGEANQSIKVVCGRFFLRLGRISESGKYPIWMGAGTTVLIPCQGTMTVSMKP